MCVNLYAFYCKYKRKDAEEWKVIPKREKKKQKNRAKKGKKGGHNTMSYKEEGAHLSHVREQETQKKKKYRDPLKNPLFE